MKVRVYTMAMPMAVVLSLDTTKNLIARGTDPNLPNTVYFQQPLTVEFINAVGKPRFNMPITPEEYLDLEIVDEGSSKTLAELNEIICAPLNDKPVYLSPADQEYFRCAKWMAQYVGTLSPGTYQREHVTFKVFDVIADNGQEISTPARVDHNSGVVHIAKKYFDTYTVPMRMFILAHERVHYVKDTSNESEADINALNICLKMGFPKMELLYAATKVFPDTPASRERIQAIYSFIESY